MKLHYSLISGNVPAAALLPSSSSPAAPGTLPSPPYLETGHRQRTRVVWVRHRRNLYCTGAVLENMSQLLLKVRPLPCKEKKYEKGKKKKETCRGKKEEERSTKNGKRKCKIFAKREGGVAAKRNA